MCYNTADYHISVRDLVTEKKEQLLGYFSNMCEIDAFNEAKCIISNEYPELKNEIELL